MVGEVILIAVREMDLDLDLVVCGLYLNFFRQIFENSKDYKFLRILDSLPKMS